MAFLSGEGKRGETPVLDERFGHIAFIMDGNGRWAKKRGLSREFGHKAGAKVFREVCRYCQQKYDRIQSRCRWCNLQLYR